MGARPVATAAVSAALAVVASATPAFALTTTVANQNDSGTGSLRQAIDEAGPGDTIVVPAGTYTLTSGALSVNTSLTISGAGAASTVIRQSMADRVIDVGGASTVATIADVTIRDGDVPGTGGGINVQGGTTVTVIRSEITHNTAQANGNSGQQGGIALGGGIASTGTLTVLDSSITGNLVQALGGSGKFGGITDGGGIGSEGSGDLTVVNSSITANVVDARGGQGAPDANQFGGVGAGGGIYFVGSDPASLTLTNSTVSGNLVDGSAGPGGSKGGLADGGGIFSSTSSAKDAVLTNLTVSGNTAQSFGDSTAEAHGGGIDAYSNGSASTLLRNVTVADNTADLGESGGVGGNILPHGAVKALNTVVSGGHSTPGAENCGGPLVSVGHNLDSRDQCGFSVATDKRNTDPLLGPLHDNGGPAQTRAITAESPAFDAGSGDLCPATDERGVIRPQAAACDIGAFELEFADLALAQTATPTRLTVGAIVTFTLTATDGGAGTAHATTVTDTLPAGLALISTTPSSGTCNGATTITCAVGDITAGTAATVAIVARATSPGTAVNTASASSPTNDPNPGDNSASVSVIVDAAALPALRLTGARISPKTFRKGSKLPRVSRVRTGTTISFTLSDPSTVRFAFARRKGTRFVAAGSFSMRAHRGRNKVRFQGRLTRRRSLRPGRFRLTLTARDAAGRRAKAKPLRLRITS